MAANSPVSDKGAAVFLTTTSAAYLAPAEYVDSDHPLVTARARALCADAGTRRGAARAVYYFVRDLRYEGGDFEDLEIYRASSVLAARHGYCVGKAVLCAALARAAGIPRPLARHPGEAGMMSRTDYDERAAAAFQAGRQLPASRPGAVACRDDSPCPARGLGWR
jgi:transglutaminase-like putative cysteine protease